MGISQTSQISQISKSIIVVPARLDSSRLPKKVLAEIKGKPMLIRVLEQCKNKGEKVSFFLISLWKST